MVISMEEQIKKLLEENEILKKENDYLKRLLKDNNIDYKIVNHVHNIEYSKEEKKCN